MIMKSFIKNNKKLFVIFIPYNGINDLQHEAMQYHI